MSSRERAQFYFESNCLPYYDVRDTQKAKRRAEVKAKTVAVAGAGIGGLTAALALVQKGFDVLMFEKATSLGEVGAGLQMSPNAMHILQDLGVAESLQTLAFKPKHACIRHYQTGEYYLKQALAEDAEQRYGAPYLHIHRADLHRELTLACEQQGVKIHLGTSVLGFKDSALGVDLMLESGALIHADVVIGADGIHSKIREQLLGKERPTFMKQIAWRGLVPVDQVKHLNIQPDASVWVGPDKHVVTYFVKGGTLVNFVAVEEKEEWHAESWTEKGNTADLIRRFSGWHPEVTGLLEKVDSSFLWALNSRPSLPTWRGENVVLLGDACHPMLPFMAQGAAMAIEDAYVLAKQLGEHDVPTALLNYEAIRKPRATKIQQMSAANAGLYHMHGGLLGKVKLKAMQLATSVAPSIVQSKLDLVYRHDVIRG